jgi:hypothetical protein
MLSIPGEFAMVSGLNGFEIAISIATGGEKFVKNGGERKVAIGGCLS